MKKAVSALGAFCLGAFITIGVMACADDYSQVTPSIENGAGGTGDYSDSSTEGKLDGKLVETIENHDLGEKRKYTYSYDEEGRISQIYYHYYAPETEHEYETNRTEIYVVKYSEDTAEIRMDNREMSITFKFNRPIIDCSTDLINEQILLRFHAPLI